MLRTYRKILYFICISFCLAEPVFAETSSGLDMGRVFSSGLLSSLYGGVVIGGANTVIILMSDDTKSNMYRVKYGFAIGTILGLVYGTVMGIQGLPLIPSFDSDGGGGNSKAPSNKSHIIHSSIFYALYNLNIEISKEHCRISTNLITIPLSTFL